MTVLALVRRTVLRLACLLTVVGSASGVLAADLFPDKNLEAVVRQYVFAKRDNNMPLVEADVQNISTIKGNGKKIANLAGLEKCVSLASLELANNEIADLAPIKDLTSIQSLILAKNKISNLGPLANLTALQYIELQDNEISDLAPLAKMEKCYFLELSRNKITDVGQLAGLKTMGALYLRDNPVADIKPLAGLKKLQRLDLRGCGVADLAPLSGLSENEWTYLMLDKNKITDLAVLVNMAKADNAGQKRFAPFWRIYLFGNPLADAAQGQIEELKKLGGRVFMEETK